MSKTEVEGLIAKGSRRRVQSGSEVKRQGQIAVKAHIVSSSLEAKLSVKWARTAKWSARKDR